MPVINEALEIPVEIAKEIARGHFVRYGGVVRVAEGFEGAGQFVKLLDPANVVKAGGPEALEKAGVLAPRLIQLVAAHKVIIIVAGVTVVVVTAGVVTYKVIKHKELKEMETVHQKFDDYISAVKAGNVDFLVVDQLIKALDELKTKKNYDKLKFEMTPEELTTIIEQYSKYAQKMSDNDHIVEGRDMVTESDKVFDLRSFLELQKKAIIEAA